MTKETIALVIATLAFVVAGVAIFFGSGGTSFSGITEYQKKSFSEGFFAGSNRQTEVDRNGRVTLGAYAEGTCNLSQSTPGSHAATSSMEYFCAVTGVEASDTVVVMLPPGAGAYTSGAQSLYGGFAVNSAYATTSNRIGVLVVNLTGGATSSAAQATTSAHYLIFD
jgi:hypothetical protein